jgi:hypothetical protein
MFLTITLVFVASAAFGAPDTVTYQGSLLNSLGKAVPDGTYRMQFKLFDDTGTRRWQETHDVEVVGGLFATALGGSTPLHPIFMSYPDLWLEVTIDVDRSGTFEASEVYSPRQNLAGAPWACPRVEPHSESPNLIGGLSNNHATGGVVGATISGGGTYIDTGPITRIRPNRVTDNYGTVGGGEGNRAGDNIAPVDSATYTTIGGGLDNLAGGPNATVGGGQANEASGGHSTVAGGMDNITTASHATISGGESNRASGALATIGGGSGNQATDSLTAIGGGQRNLASELCATVCGGRDNTAEGYDATVGGGWMNTASGDHSAIGGGQSNSTGESNATVGGGRNNAATGYCSTVPGGYWCEAAGDYSFAAGYHAKADHRGSFVLADSDSADFSSAREDQLRCRFNGGATFQVNDGYWFRVWHDTAPSPAHVLDASNGAHLTAGGTWVNGSDRNSKENFEPVSGREVLEKLADVPIQQWNYKAEDSSVRHMGPMAQDLHSAFGLGGDDKSIATIDADGIALAAIQGLCQQLREKQQHIETQESRIAELERQNADILRRLNALETDR